MTQCDRSNCKKEILRRTEAGNAGLCEKHYQTFLFNQQNQEVKLLSMCQCCGDSLAETRNEKYCSAACRQKGSRKINTNNTVSILNSSYWKHINSTYTRNPLVLGSITGPEDVVDFHQLYQIKARHQRSYTILTYEWGQVKMKLVALLCIEICHMYPNGKGGANIAGNLIIAPELINRRNRDVIPYQGHGFDGIKSAGECIPFNGSLYDGLVERYGVLTVNEELSRVTPVRRFHGNVPRKIEFGGIEQQLPLFTLLHGELWRLGHHRISECLGEIRQLFPEYPLYLELLAIVGFHAVLSGDPDRVMALLCRVFNKCFDVASSLREPHKQCIGLMYRLLRKYLRRYFSVEIDSREAVVAFYNGFYSQEIIAPGDADDEVVCFRYSTGIKHSSTTFFYVLPQKKEPFDLWRLMGEDLTFE
ncbi:hypothetical protein ACXDHU_004553 [Klebsiella pneumoniae]|uniref:hypothetical protein n=1 Tax=Klebsiella pneumoniae TaxID=573 RepID=UPI000659BF1F|nr:hypothetical protein [Klebsiella pneumoniae]HBQ5728308.1 hypothetical protein [Klebsiella pneumoniae subsp. pneumoniae]KMH34090.1 hypothetical protein SM72_04769 [Klebsiella pneumoniae]MCB3273492.1 hypothetical protein [Klebsiella pneumoniae]MEA4697006.1 hypothetical protein [Klebsiella pneumoniae]MEC4336168.1 hypothetical protein [Klebsiella pneumoniae]